MHPYIVEIDLCEYLLKYCKKQVKNPEAEAEIDELTKYLDKSEAEEKRRKAIEESLSKGKIMRGKTKEERQQEENMFVGL